MYRIYIYKYDSFYICIQLLIIYSYFGFFAGMCARTPACYPLGNEKCRVLHTQHIKCYTIDHIYLAPKYIKTYNSQAVLLYSNCVRTLITYAGRGVLLHSPGCRRKPFSLKTWNDTGEALSFPVLVYIAENWIASIFSEFETILERNKCEYWSTHIFRMELLWLSQQII